jgi:seryl-tRNA synthetase
LKDDLLERQLAELRNNLQLQVNKLDKLFKVSKKNDEDHTKTLKLDCDRLRESTQGLKQTLNLLVNKLDHCENVMGIYSGKEKHRL